MSRLRLAGWFVAGAIIISSAAALAATNDRPPSWGGVVSSSTSSCSRGVSYDANGVLGCVLTTDTAPRSLSIHPEHNYAQGAQAPGNLNLGGSADEKKYTGITRANCAGDTMTVTIDGNANTLVEDGTQTAGHWNRGASDAEACSNLASQIRTLTGVDQDTTRTLCSSGTVYVTLQRTTMNLQLASSDPTCATANSGTDGIIKAWSSLYTSNSTGPAILNSAAAITTPNLLPNQATPTYGVSWGGNYTGIVGGGVANLQVGQFEVQFPNGASNVQATFRSKILNDTDDLRFADNYYLDSGNTKGFRHTTKCVQEILTFGGGGGDASKTTTASFIPDGASLESLTSRVTTTATGCTSVDIGVTGVDVDAFADNAGITSGTTTDGSHWTTQVTTAAALQAKPVLANTAVTVLGVGGNCVSGVWRITACYTQPTAETSN